MTRSDNILGLILIIVGVILLITSLSPLIVPILFVLLALWLINYGMRMRQMPPLTLIAMSWWSRFRR